MVARPDARSEEWLGRATPCQYRLLDDHTTSDSAITSRAGRRDTPSSIALTLSDSKSNRRRSRTSSLSCVPLLDDDRRANHALSPMPLSHSF